MNPYKILDIEHDATDRQIKTAYRKQCNACHPDKHAHKDEIQRNAFEQQFHRVQWAYELLSDPQDRAYFDQYGRARTKGGEQPLSKVDATIAGIFREVFDPTNYRITTTDYARSIRLKLTDQRIEARSHIKRMQGVLEGLESAKGRFLRKGDSDNTLAHVLEADIEQFKQAIQGKTEEAEHLKRCLDEIQHYTYTTEDQSGIFASGGYIPQTSSMSFMVAEQ